MDTSAYRAEMIAKGIWTKDGKRTPRYAEALRGQIRLWMLGIATHNRVSNECCPDFSCCHADMMLAPEKRQEIGQRLLLKFAADVECLPDSRLEQRV